ncbi:MAG: hypothetical protein AB1813_19125 [Verrucomicrobiota bacterium]|jgi:hypothetical protein
MNLEESQKQQVRQWIDQGFSLSDIQNKLSTEFGLRLTYMEVRFLLDDLKLNPKDKEPAPAPATLGDKSRAATPPPAGKQKADAQPETPERPAGRVSVSVDQVTRPGAVVSGRVTFSDGNSAEWYLDQLGRLGLASKQQGYRPPQEDIMEFQAQLQSELAKLGF